MINVEDLIFQEKQLLNSCFFFIIVIVYTLLEVIYVKDNKYDVKELYYATITDNKNYVDNGIFKITKDVIDIKTNTKYSIICMNSSSILLNGGILLKGILPFKQIIPFMEGKYTLGRILKADKSLTVKEYNSEKEMYLIRNISEVQQTLAIIKPDGVKNAIKIIEMIYKEGLKIEKYEVRMLDEEILKSLIDEDTTSVVE